MPMFPLSEETSAVTEVPSHVPEHLAVPPPVAGQGQDRNLLRRASMAAMQRLHGRGRVATISEPHGTAQDQGAAGRPQSPELYDSQFVDFLDVVGMYNGKIKIQRETSDRE